MADWRVDNAKWTRGAVLRFQKYWAKFMESGLSEVLTEGYVTQENRRWICPDCFRDLSEEMGWKLV
jgi:hypothetical protein